MLSKLQDLDEFFLKKTDQVSEWFQTEKGIPLPTLLAASVWSIYLCYSIMMLNWSIQTTSHTLFLVIAAINTVCWAPVGYSYYKRLDEYYKHAEDFDNEDIRTLYSARALIEQQVSSGYRIYLMVVLAWEVVTCVLLNALECFDPSGTIGLYNLPDGSFFLSLIMYSYFLSSFPRTPRKRKKLVLATVTGS